MTWLNTSYLMLHGTMINVRGSGKYYAVKFESDTNMDWRLDGYALEVQDAGRRGSRSY